MTFAPLRQSALLAATTLCLLVALAGTALAAGVPAPGPRDKCPVCGMFVAKYPDWTATVQFRDNSRSYFDGVKDMMKFFHAPEKYGSKGGAAAITAVGVKDYYSLEIIDGRAAYYVIGSDVLGPMGKELIPFARKDDAAEFLKDHRGKRILRFTDLKADILRQLD